MSKLLKKIKSSSVISNQVEDLDIHEEEIDRYDTTAISLSNLPSRA